MLENLNQRGCGFLVMLIKLVSLMYGEIICLAKIFLRQYRSHTDTFCLHHLSTLSIT